MTVSSNPQQAASQRFESNIEALSGFQPELASLLRFEPVPDHATPTVGRDGSDTYRLHDEDGSVIWFGRSSMPTISAAGWLGGFQSDGGHVLLPGIHTGLEPLILSERLPVFAAVFVAEPSLSAIKLAMYLYDYTSVITAHRLVFLHGDDVLASFNTFYQAHGGFDQPTQLVPAPDWTTASVKDCQELLELAASVIHRLHDEKIKDARQALRSPTPGPLCDKPSVALLSVNSDPDTLDYANRIDRGFSVLGWRHTICVPNAPDHGHVVARLVAIQETDADIALFVNCAPGRLQSLVPDDFRLASWFLSESCAGAGASDTTDGTFALRRSFRIFAGSETIREVLMATGLKRDIVTLCEPGADPLCCRGDDPFDGTDENVSVPVAVVVDLPDDSPEGAGLNLASHLTLWRTLRGVVAENADLYDEAMIDELVKNAQERCGVALQEQDIRSQFVGWFRSRIAPAGLARACIEALHKSGVEHRVWGANWQKEATAKDCHGGLFPNGVARRALLAGTRVVVLSRTDLAAAQTALDALAMGRRVVWRVRREEFEHAYPSLVTVSPFIHFFQSRSELSGHLARLASISFAASDRDREAMRLVRKQHTLMNRLVAIASAFR